MPLETAKTANLGEARIVINAHLQIGIAHPRGSRSKFVGQAKYAGIAGQLQRSEMQITVRGDGRHAVRVDREPVGGRGVGGDGGSPAHEMRRLRLQFALEGREKRVEEIQK